MDKESPRTETLAATFVDAARDTSDVEVLHSDAVLPHGLPFSNGVRVGRLVILSRQNGIVPGPQ